MNSTTTLAECPIGLFLASSGELCLKSEYGDNRGRIDAYIVSTGELFWGSAPQTVQSQRSEKVRPIDGDLLKQALIGLSEADKQQVEVQNTTTKRDRPVSLLGAIRAIAPITEWPSEFPLIRRCVVALEALPEYSASQTPADAGLLEVANLFVSLEKRSPNGSSTQGRRAPTVEEIQQAKDAVARVQCTADVPTDGEDDVAFLDRVLPHLPPGDLSRVGSIARRATRAPLQTTEDPEKTALQDIALSCVQQRIETLEKALASQTELAALYLGWYREKIDAPQTKQETGQSKIYVVESRDGFSYAAFEPESSPETWDWKPAKALYPQQNENAQLVQLKALNQSLMVVLKPFHDFYIKWGHLPLKASTVVDGVKCHIKPASDAYAAALLRNSHGQR